MIGDKIREARILKGYSQEYVSDGLGISQPYYSYIERSKSKITLDKINQLAAILEISTSDLLGFDEKPSIVLNEGKDNFEGERNLYNSQINSLKDEILYLRKKLDERN